MEVSAMVMRGNGSEDVSLEKGHTLQRSLLVRDIELSSLLSAW